MSSARFACVLVALIASYGCFHETRGTYALASSTAVPEEHREVVGAPVRGEFCYCRFLEPLRCRDDIKEKYRKAALDALGKAPGANALIDVRISITSGACARVEGTPVTLH